MADQRPLKKNSSSGLPREFNSNDRAIIKGFITDSGAIIEVDGSGELNFSDSVVTTPVTLEDLLEGPSGLSRVDQLCFSDNGQPYISTAQNTYIVRAQFVFLGTTTMGAVNAIKALVSTDATTGWIKIMDVTNVNVIAEKSFTNGTFDIVDMGTLSNLPASQAVFEVEMKKSGTGGMVKLASIITEY